MFGGTFGKLRFDDKSLFNKLSGFPGFWDYKSTNANHADSPGVYINEKFLSLSTIDKIHLECHVIDGSVVNVFQEPILFSFVLMSQAIIKCFASPKHFKKGNRPVLNTITFYLEVKTHEEVNFNQEILTFKLQMIKI